MTSPRLVGGRYELGELIGYGGMAEVHRGRDIRLGREVAIKVLRADLARDPSFLNRFRREAQSAAGLNHPSIVSVYDTGEDIGAEGTALPYIVMEYVEGRTLRDILKSEGRLPVRRAMEVAADVCAALDFSHRAGLVHRDVKPANVMITRAGAVKVMDFGIARAVADSGATVTQTANVIGTAQYLSPEQARGESVDARSDVYSTGCLLYELVTGTPPFQGDSPVAVAYQHVRENATAPSTRVPELPRALDSIVMKALAKNPLNRYQSAGEMRTDLQRALADQPVTAETVMTDAERTQFIQRAPAPPVPPAPRQVYADEGSGKRVAWIWAAVVVALLLVLGIGGFFIYKVNSSDKSPAATQTTFAAPELIGQTVTQAQATVTAFNTKNCDPGTSDTCGLVLQPNTTDGSSTSGTCGDGKDITTDGQICTITNDAGKPVGVGDDISVPDPQTAPVPLYYQTYQHAVVTVPYILGKTPDDAMSQLKPLGLKLQVLTQTINTFDYDPGQIATQTPLNNATVAKGSTIKVALSSGKKKLPDVSGKSCDAAQSQLNELWTNVVQLPAERIRNHSKVGDAYKTDPAAGNLYGPNIKITVYCYRYKPPPTTIPTTTPPPTTATCNPSITSSTSTEITSSSSTEPPTSPTDSSSSESTAAAPGEASGTPTAAPGALEAPIPPAATTSDPGTILPTQLPPCS